MKTFILSIAIILSSHSLTTFAEPSTLLKNVKSCFSGSFETYTKWVSLLESKKKNFNKEKFEKTFTEQQFNNIKTKLVCKNFRYEVDGYTVEGYYLKTRNSSNKELPVVIYNRGGNDINDVLKLIEIAKEIPEADTSKIGMVGWSRGVMQSYIASKSIPSLKTLIAIAGNSDTEKALIWRPKMEKVYKVRIPNFDKNRSSELASRSVSKWLDKIPSTMSILLLHGDKDKRVNVEQSKSLADQLELRKHPHKLIIYPNDNHGLVRHRKEMTQEIILWLKKQLI